MTDANTAAALGSLHNAWLDLTAARLHVLHARRDLQGPRTEQADQLAAAIGDLLHDCRFLSMAIEEDLREEGTE